MFVKRQKKEYRLKKLNLWAHHYVKRYFIIKAAKFSDLAKSTTNVTHATAAGGMDMMSFRISCCA